MEKIKPYLLIGILGVLSFASYKIAHIFGALDRAERLINSAITKIDAADAKIVTTQKLLNQLDSIAVINQKQVNDIKLKCQSLDSIFKKAQYDDRQQLRLNKNKLDSIYESVQGLPIF